MMTQYTDSLVMSLVFFQCPCGSCIVALVLAAGILTRLPFMATLSKIDNSPHL